MPSAAVPPPTSQGSSEEEDDYLTMSFGNTSNDSTAPSTKSNLSITALHRRRQLHAETAGRPKSKAELQAEEERKRNEGLGRRIGTGEDKTNKGLAMMRKLGWKEGQGLGADAMEGKMAEGADRVAAVRLDPLAVEIKDGKEGIGMESERKRKFRERFEREMEGEKRRRVEEGEYRERVAKEREKKRVEGQCFGAMKVLEGLDGEKDNDVNGNGANGEDDEEKVKKRPKGTRPLSSIPVVYRSLVKSRRLEERDKRMRHDLQQSFSRRPEYDDLEEDTEDEIALGKKQTLEEVDDTELDEEDEELAQFEALDSKERLKRLVDDLRAKWTYCFWCKYRYEDEKEMEESCPGTTEEDHD